MEQREVTDTAGTIWTCVQAYAGLDEEKAEKVAALTDVPMHQVDVVCTPRGGAQSVRLQLPENWFDDLSDEELIAAITAAR